MGKLSVLLILALAVAAHALPNRVATILVHVRPDGRIDGRRASSDRLSSLRHLGWVKALRPPGVCVRTALQDRVPIWLDWGEIPAARRALYPHALPVVWDARGLLRYIDYIGRHGEGPLPMPVEIPPEAMAWARARGGGG